VSEQSNDPIPMTIEQAIALLEGATANASAPLRRAVEVLSRAAKRGVRISSTSNQRVLDVATLAEQSRSSSQRILDILHVGNVEAGIEDPKGGR
jgi:hypothetical protein